MSKVSVLAAGAIGYVLGARAGRERYEQIAAYARQFAGDPRVQRTAHQAVDVVRDKAPEVGAYVADAAKATAAKVTSHGDDDAQPAS